MSIATPGAGVAVEAAEFFTIRDVATNNVRDVYYSVTVSETSVRFPESKLNGGISALNLCLTSESCVSFVTSPNKRQDDIKERPSIIVFQVKNVEFIHMRRPPVPTYKLLQFVLEQSSEHVRLSQCTQRQPHRGLPRLRHLEISKQIAHDVTLKPQRAMLRLKATEFAAPGRILFQSLRYSQTTNSAGLQVSFPLLFLFWFKSQIFYLPLFGGLVILDVGVWRVTRNQRIFEYHDLGVDRVKRPLQYPYDGPFKVISRKDKYFTTKRNGKPDSVSIDRLKVAYVDDSNPDSPAQVDSHTRPQPSCTAIPKQPDPVSQPADEHPLPILKHTRTGRTSKTPIRFADYNL
ncbi:hypothetical protein T265_00814 [Opisthorchis viverrini]|uniref:Uncharacterized protein n=1 Tax=Opisthorchis viverrini TaxID=6198 RepID=A0A075A1S4_OPIVI|nr:hypothetical protein T265_00814 [Opisthorchis viverrini]KER33316.1 hypothetical protein T265_00814 [Opisthorchis viverrini]